MATELQTNYIADLAVLKTKEFKEVKELIFANNIAAEGSKIVGDAASIAEITNALTDKQASQLIDVLVSARTPERGRIYSPNRINRATAALDDVKATIDDWGF